MGLRGVDMEKITFMKITNITFTDFRNHKESETYSFGDISYITGHNGTGKTTMAHGIAYALFGVTLIQLKMRSPLLHKNY